MNPSNCPKYPKVTTWKISVNTVNDAVIPNRNLTALLDNYYIVDRSPISKTFANTWFPLCCDLTTLRILLAVSADINIGLLG
jgi:hypothetical protein